jgi:uncharacterized membrane protein YedE/YeeE
MHKRTRGGRAGKDVAAIGDRRRRIHGFGNADGLRDEGNWPMTRILQFLATLISGTLFGLGLALSGMLDPVRVRGFLDVTGNWDPSLAFVMGGALAVTAAGVALSKRMKKPAFASAFALPTNTKQIDFRLVAGSSLFGIGWGMAGLCPGPAVSLLSTGFPIIVAFIVAMATGMLVYDRVVAKSL